MVVATEDGDRCPCVQCRSATSFIVRAKDATTSVADLVASLKASLGAGYDVSAKPTSEGTFSVQVTSSTTDPLSAQTLLLSLCMFWYFDIFFVICRNEFIFFFLQLANSNLVASASLDSNSIGTLPTASAVDELTAALVLVIVALVSAI